MNFNYRQALGELLYTMVSCRLDIPISVTKLSQYSQNPAEIHYVLVKNIFRYLRSTKMAVVFAGAVIAYKSRIQKTIALSSMEAEFMAACDAGKTILYLRTILKEMGVEQNEATALYEDSQGALMIANAQQPTRRTRHLDTATFALQDWVARDLVNLTYVASHKNCSDGMTKPLLRILFYKHFDVLMGRMVPEQFRKILNEDKKLEEKIATEKVLNSDEKTNTTMN